MHYEGKTHDKHVRNFINKWAEKNGVTPSTQRKVPLSKKPKTVSIDTSETLVLSSNYSITRSFQDDASDWYCSPCSLSFTSQLHMDQHMAGRNHARLVQGWEYLLYLLYRRKKSPIILYRRPKSLKTSYILSSHLNFFKKSIDMA